MAGRPRDQEASQGNIAEDGDCGSAGRAARPTESCHYNSRVLAVRYATLLSLAIWLGGLIAFRLLDASSSDLARHFDVVGYACGAVVLMGLLVAKFIGPPPRAFIPRMGLVLAMLAISAYASLAPQTSSLPRLLEIALGLPLLFWYVNE